MRKALPIKLDDEKSERVRLSHQLAIEELQAQPGAHERIVSGVSLVSGKATTIPHGLGRAPMMVTVSVPRGAVSAGYIVETRSGGDLTAAVTLTANGYGATVVVDVSFR